MGQKETLTTLKDSHFYMVTAPQGKSKVKGQEGLKSSMGQTWIHIPRAQKAQEKNEGI